MDALPWGCSYQNQAFFADRAFFRIFVRVVPTEKPLPTSLRFPHFAVIHTRRITARIVFQQIECGSPDLKMITTVDYVFTIRLIPIFPQTICDGGYYMIFKTHSLTSRVQRAPVSGSPDHWRTSS